MVFVPQNLCEIAIMMCLFLGLQILNHTESYFTAATLFDVLLDVLHANNNPSR